MSVSDIFSTVLKVRRFVAIISIVAGAGYKFGPVAWHKAEAKMETRSVMAGLGSTNSITAKTSGCDLGAISLTNHSETCVQLGGGKDCILTPRMLDSHNLQLTLTVESKTAAGKIHDLSVTQIVTRSGKPFEVAVGGLSLSLTPNVTSE